MHTISSPELTQFREQCRDWLAENTPREKRPLDGAAMRDFDRKWQRKQYDGGWAGINWPKEYGGRGATILEQLIWYEEYARAGAPASGTMFVAVSHAGPTLIVSGTEAQKSKYLPTILTGEENWCQGFSEPGSGSDLASLKCKAEIDGDELVINGTKIWTTYGDLAVWQELLVRTDPDLPRHKGISWVICDMRLPGIEIRPIKAMSGLTHFAQVFYDDVRVPLKNLVGELNGGWRVAMTTLSFERGTATIAHQIELSNAVDHLITVAKSRPGGIDEVTAEELAQLKIDVLALRSLTTMSVSRALVETVPGAEGNIVALYFSELSRRVHGYALDLLGPQAMLSGGDHNYPLHYLESFKWGIGGGTIEIRRNAIGERLLGLPRGAKPK